MSKMMSESLDAPNKVRAALKQDVAAYEKLGARLREINPRVVATIARGSSDNAATYAEYLIPLCTGRVVASLPPSLVTVLKADLQLEGQFALALSQGGGSPDIRRSLELARKNGALTAALVNDMESPLAKVSEVLLGQHAGPEQSITATKSVICTLVGIARLAAAWSEDQALQTALQSLPEVLERAAKAGEGLDDTALKGVSHVYVLSRGLGYSAARELALKLKETCGIHGEPFSAAEVRHGPREIVDQKFLVIALAMLGSEVEDVKAVAEEMRAQGARVILVGPPGCGAQFEMPAPDDYRLTPIVALQLLYPWLARSAESLGRDPDHPKTLKNKVIKTV